MNASSTMTSAPASSSTSASSLCLADNNECKNDENDCYFCLMSFHENILDEINKQI